MSIIATTDETSNVTSLPSNSKAQTAKEVIAANVKLLIQSSQGEADSKQPQRSLPKVLVVDDERRIADTLTEILEMAGFQVVTAYDGWEAVEVAIRFRPDYLLSDVLMPRMNGVELAIAIRKIYPAATILLFSGQAGMHSLEIARQRLSSVSKDQSIGSACHDLIPHRVSPRSLAMKATGIGP